MNINRQNAGTIIAGAAVGGQFAASVKTEADGAALSTVPTPPAPEDEVTLEELNAAVDFTARDEKIRALWGDGSQESLAQAEELSAELVKDTLKWRYPDATSVLLTESGGQTLFIGELRDRDGKPVAWDHQMGGVEQGAVDYSETAFLDEDMNGHLWGHVDGLPRTGANAPRKVPGNQLRGIGEGSSDTYRFALRNVQPSKRARFEASDVTDEDWEEGVQRLAIDLGDRDDPSTRGMDLEHRASFIRDNARDYRAELGPLAAAASNRNMVARLHRIGATHPLDAVIEKDWEDRSRRDDGSPGNPWSYAAQQTNISRAAQLRRQLTNKEIKPSQIIGTGYRSPRKQAFEYLDRMQADAQRAIDTRGRSLVDSRFSESTLRATAQEVRAEFEGGLD